MNCMRWLLAPVFLQNFFACHVFDELELQFEVPKCRNDLLLCTLENSVIVSNENNSTLRSHSKISKLVPVDAKALRSTMLLKENILQAALKKTGLVRGNLLSNRRAVKLEIVRQHHRLKRSTSSLCEENSQTLVPEVGQNLEGQWRLLGGEIEVTATYCLDSSNVCTSNLQDSRCTQRFGEVPLPVFNGILFKTENIKVPCGCICEISK